MLEQARSSYIDALNVLAAIKMRKVSFTTEDLMMAYMVVSEWCEWLERPNMEGSPLSGKHSTADSYATALNLMREHRKDLEIMLADEMDFVDVVFRSLNPNLLQIGKRIDAPGVPESTQRYYKMLTCTAKFFKDQTGYGGFCKILENC